METIGTDDLTAQLRRLIGIGTHNLAEAETLWDRAYERGQLNALRAVAISYGLTLEE